MLRNVRATLTVFIGISIITGLIYPLVITGAARLIAPDKARGSIVRDADGKPIASALIGQEFAAGDAKTAAGWFWGRPSATSPVPYTALDLEKGAGSSGSNLAPSNPALLDNVRARLQKLREADQAVGLVREPGAGVPLDLVTSSASGLDPHISPQAAEYQLPRVARARGMREDALRVLIRKHTTRRTFGVLGEPVVDYGAINRELAGVQSR